MNKESRLKEINTELKIYINESSFISNSCRNKIIRYLGDAFDIRLPIEDFASIDVSLLEDGSIEMRDEIYQREGDLSFDEILERYDFFKEKADSLLAKKNKSSFPLNDSNNIKNLFIVLLLSILFVILCIYTLRSFFAGDYVQCIWLFLFISTWIFPSVRDRFIQAFNYIKRNYYSTTI